MGERSEDQPQAHLRQLARDKWNQPAGVDGARWLKVVRDGVAAFSSFSRASVRGGTADRTALGNCRAQLYDFRTLETKNAHRFR